METPRPPSFFEDLKLREVNGFRVKKRPYPTNEMRDLDPAGAVAVEHRGEPSPPMALSFGKTSKTGHILALSDEGGYVNLFDTRKRFVDSSSYQENAEKAKVSEWVGHNNAIFDLCWNKDDANILTASGDQSIKVWDVQEQTCIRVLTWHTGSVKSISCHPTNHNLVVSGSRDGSFALWDTRCSDNTNQKLNLRDPFDKMPGAHTSSGRRRCRRGKAESMSITSVLYLKDEVSVATAGAVDSVIKFWDTRHLKGPVICACPNPESSTKEKRHGISSLSQDLNGVFVTASCMDHRIYLYNVLQLEKGPAKTFSGGRTESFFVKSAISPDAAHILSGSSDGNAYIWQVKKPQCDPITLKSHDGEVTAVDWCPSETGKVATCSDDFTVRFWNIKNSCYSSTRSPSSMRKIVRSFPKIERKKLFLDETSCKKTDLESTCLSETCHVDSPQPNRTPEVSTPESMKKKFSLSFEVKENLDKTPEAEYSSPSSVLNPPSSLKRKTIRDYFPVS
ncbi:Transducin/WD40 repeat-like superfamily protein [Striga hermonthica]|uniref:Transducin/WD40 repeat-like superfamily protein n=1 Tax=Striga hermonthica TaxID=68872 RepID=A0A9N7R8C2_STRHE|nr:Transducin/WD40 repeat-like superfamily protein [Striga hermonthica]